MADFITINGIQPKCGSKTWIASNATISGDVNIGEDCSVWFQVVIRGDVNKIVIGNQTNIQDASIIHGSTGGIDTTIGNRVSIGHRAIVHGCTIHDDVLIGMGAIILDEAVVQSNVVVAAGAVVTNKSILESGYIYAGIPARKIKALSIEAVKSLIHDTASSYVVNKELYR